MSTLKVTNIENLPGTTTVAVDGLVSVNAAPSVGDSPVWTGTAWEPVPGGSGGAPTGPAGGVLGGTYPNPGFAVDMATQAELDAAIATRAPTVHTHSLSQLTQSGAAIGEVPVWSGTAWEPGTGGGGGVSAKRVAVVGDSLTADNALLAPAWPALLERLLNASGARVEVHNLAINGWTYQRANTEAAFGANTMRDELIALAPDVVICAMGRNDADTLPGVRPLATLIADATTFYNTVAAALPDAVIVNAAPLLYDSVHATAPGTTLLNRQVMPVYFNLPASGITASAYGSEMLGDSVTADTKTRTTNMIAINAAVAALASVDAVYTFPVWKACRLGCVGYDTLHNTAEGSVFFAAAARDAFNTIPALAAALPGLSNQNYAPFNIVDYIFDGLVQSSGGQYVNVTPSRDVNHTVAQWGPWRAALPVTWYLPSKGEMYVANPVYTLGLPFVIALIGAPPSTAVQMSFDGAAFAAIGASTDGRGSYYNAMPLPVLAGSHTLRVKVGNEIYGPVTFTANPASGGGVSQALFDSTVGAIAVQLQGKLDITDAVKYGPAVMTGANLRLGTQAVTAGGRTYIDFDATNVRISNPQLLSIAKVGGAGVETRLNITVPTGKRVFWRLSTTVFTNASSGSDIAKILGAEQIRTSTGATDYNLQMALTYSPINNYATVTNAVLVGAADYSISLVPWLLSTGNTTIESNSPNGFSTFYSLEIISVVDL